jgi:putative transposase
MLGFIDTMRAEGHAVESICRVLREQGHQIAARTYRSQRRGVVAARTVTDAQVHGAVRDAAWTTVEINGRARRMLTPEGLYGRRKMTALIRRTTIPDASRGAIDRAMRTLGLEGIRRDKGVRTTIPGKDGIRAGDLLNRDFTAPRPDHTWVMDFTYCRTWAGWVYVAFIVDVYSQRIVAWHAQTSKHVELVMIPLRMGLWERDRQGHPILPDQLRAHSDAGSQDVSLAYTEKLALDGIAPSIGSVGDSLLTGYSDPDPLGRHAALVHVHCFSESPVQHVVHDGEGSPAVGETRRRMGARWRPGGPVQAGRRVSRASAGPELLTGDGAVLWV